MKHIFSNNDWVYVWRTSKETYDVVCLLSTVKHGRGSILICVAIFWYSAYPLIDVTDQITVNEYLDILNVEVNLSWWAQSPDLKIT